jgi:uncharacterized protein (DUF983 family)
MNVTDTNLFTKCCSKCGITKIENLFIKNRNICKECRNLKSREKYNISKINDDTEQTCNFCNKTKVISSFVKERKICVDCNNIKRRTKYMNDEDYRQKQIKLSTEFKQKRVFEKNKKKEEEIGIDNKKCSNCNEIKFKDRFRHNRLKCKDCERDDPHDKFKRAIRSRIISALSNKTKHTIEYLGCSSKEYFNWILTNDLKYNLTNHGSNWHIDHVIPLSHFNLEDENEQLIAFNWRNTMPLSVRENLSKNRKILKPQIEQHIKKLSEYHLENKLDLPQVFIDLFAKHLDDGKSLKLSLPLTCGNICEELG